VFFIGVLFCVGGRGAQGDPFRCIECFDFRNDKWFQIAEMSTRRRHVGVVSSEGEKLSPLRIWLCFSLRSEDAETRVILAGYGSSVVRPFG